MPRKRTGRPPGRPPHSGVLTPAEERVLERLREGKTYGEIGAELGISADGVKYHVSNMLSKLGLQSREELIAWREGGLRRRWMALPFAGKLVAGAATAAVAGLVVAAVVAAVALNRSHTGEASAVLALSWPIPFDDGVYCLPDENLCVVEPLEGGAYVVFHSLVTHDHFRANGCRVAWLRSEDFEHLGQHVPPGDTGVFRDPCGGATFTRSGRHVFGPAERDLDQHPYVERGNRLYIDTGTVIPGRALPARTPSISTPAPQPTPPPGPTPNGAP